ncbi:MAG: FAD-dependent oxidoreductase [Akkermansia sp.]|nr:FAD-dependent oxidoreductase [Akkermansia sp.]
MKTAVIGAGVSGMSLAWMLSSRHEVTVFEKEARPGGGLSAANASAMSSSIPWAATSSIFPPSRRAGLVLGAFRPGA